MLDEKDEEEQGLEPEVQEYINQDTTVVHSKDDEADLIPPPGITPGLEPGALEDRDPPRPTS